MQWDFIRCIGKWLICALIACTSNVASAQKEAWNWFLADSAGIQWVNGDSAVTVDWYNLRGEEGSGSISDSDGNLLFYTNGVDIFDYKHRKLNTDFSLNGDWSSTQGKLILKHPESNEYHVFTNKYIGLQKSQLYHTSFIWEGDSAKFINKATIISNLVGESIGAVNHQNNRDIIVMYHSLYGDTFYMQLINKNELNDCKITSINGAIISPSAFYWTMTLFFSPSGSLCSFGSGPLDYTTIDLYKFNNQTAFLSNQVNPGTIPGFFSGVFSPNDSFLYLDFYYWSIAQYSLKNWNADSINRSRKFVFSDPKGIDICTRNAPNGKLLITRRNQKYISLINDANKPYPDCGFVEKAVVLKQGTCRYGNYNTNQSYFYTPAINYKYTQDCNTNAFDFTGMDTFAASSHYWEVSKGSTLFTYSSKQAAVAFPDTGIWTVKYRASNGVRSDSVAKEIEIFPVLKGFLGPDKGYCGNALPIPLSGPKGMNCYTWQTPHGTISGLDSIAADTPGIYILEACNPVFCTYTDTIVVFEKESKVVYTNSGFTVDPISGCVPLPVTVSDTIRAGSIKKAYYFSDVDSWSLMPQTPFAHNYQNPGTYYIIQRLYDSTTCITSFDSLPITVQRGLSTADSLDVLYATYSYSLSNFKNEPAVIQLSWDSHPNAESYRVYRDQSFLTQTNLTLYSDTIFQAAPHSYHVVGVDSCGRLSAPGKVGKPIFLQGEDLGSNKFASLYFSPYLDWGNVEIEYSIGRIQAGTEDVFYTTVSDTQINDQSFMKDGALEQCYRVTARAANQVSYSNILCLPYQAVVYIPSAFSPNKDGLNDAFKPSTFGIESYTLQVFDRWGGLLYKGNRPWEPDNCTPGVYTYLFVLTTSKGQLLYKNGTVHLME